MKSVIEGLSLMAKLFALIGSLFWKKKNIIYLNSNKKICNFDDICSSRCVNPNDAKIINLGKKLPVHFK